MASGIAWLQECAQSTYVGYYLWFLAVVMAFGGFVHIGNLLGFGEKPFAETPLAWRIGDVCYSIVDIVAAIGLWLQSWWGIALFLLAVASQFVIYTFFIDTFAKTREQRRTIYGLLGTEGLLAIVLGILLAIGR